MSMQFLDKCLSDDAVHTIENMVEHHISGNYRHVRNIITGYDSNNNIWRSKYGEYIAKRYIYDIKPPITSLETRISRIITKSERSETFTKYNGMTFYDSEIYEYVRIYTDDSIKRVLEVLFTISKDVIEYRDIIDIIITEWNVNNIKDTIYSNRSYADHGICGDLHYYKLEVRKYPWEDLKKITRYKGITIRDAFKDSVITFLENRSEMLKGNIP